MKKRAIALILCLALCVSMTSMLAGCKKGEKNPQNLNAVPDAFVIMTEQLDGLFNPFFSTSANDGTIVSMTQIGMLSSKYVDGQVQVAYGDNEAVVVKDYDITEDGDNTVYTFVLKNGIKFADGHPLTMEDVLFNYYVYLDPVYTGSSTLYSTKILGLGDYRTQSYTSGSSNSDSQLADQAGSRAQERIKELLNLYNSKKTGSPTGEVSISDMTTAILGSTLSEGYKGAISADRDSVTVQQLLDDYNYALKLFKEELNDDYVNCQDSFSEEPYKSHSQFQNEIFRFMFNEGYVHVEYAKGENGKTDYTKFESLTPSYSETAITTKEAAIEYVYNDKVASAFNEIVTIWATASTLISEYTAQAKQVILAERSEGGNLRVSNIEGIKSLGHTDRKGEKITVNGTEYTIASGHNADGTVTNTNEYDVLEITIEGIDPKAIWNFAIAIAPQHYYGEGSSVGVDIENDKFGVEFANFKFMSEIIQSPRNVKLPMGAGAYKVTDANNSDSPAEGDFYKNNVVYFKANNYFETVGSGINNAKIGKIRYQIVSSNNAIGALENGSVHYISPQLTTSNYAKLEELAAQGYKTLSTDQLGYGYIGINASKVQDVNLRKAIMCAMNTSLALDYYRAGTAEQIFWNMSTVSWAYPTGSSRNDNGKDYPQMGGKWDEGQAIDNIKKYMEAANVSGGESKLRITFTIAGSTLQDHPTYKVFRDAAALLNSMGWDIKVVCDPQALTKISTGYLAVWAAAWSSALDPDMYQVYHKDSTATSTLAWGYNFIKTNGSDEEIDILNQLSSIIDDARQTNDQEERADLYEDAMGYVLDLAVELPVYQRDVLYAYNSNIINSSTVPSEVNPYSSPLDRIWELEFVS